MAIGFGTRNTNQKRPMTVARRVFDLRLLGDTAAAEKLY